MVAPIDYGVEVADPTKAFLGAFQAGAAIQDTRLKQDEQTQKIAQQKLIQDSFTKLRQPGATAADYANLAMMLPETQAKSVRESFGMLESGRQQTALQESGQVFSALKSGKPEIAISLLEQQIAAKRNSGDENGAKFLETWRDVTKENPKATEDFFGFTMSQIPGGDKVITSAIALGGEGRAAALAPSQLSEAESKAAKAKVDADFAERLAVAGLNKSNWDVKNVQSQINDRSKRFNLDSQVTAATVAEKLSSITKNINDIPADTRKLINESAVTAATSKQSADQFNNLAKRLEEAGGGFGAATSFADYMRKNTGSQSPLTELRQEYTRIRNSAAIKSLPPGVATDKDIELALKGIPPENADAGTMARFLRGMAKLQDIDSSVANAKTDWLAQNNGTLTRAKGTFIAGDFAAKPGESFNDLSQRIVTDVGKKYRSPDQIAEEKRQADFAKIPTNQTPAPAAAPVNVRSQADAILRGGK
jgi:hypothetical protein